MAHEDLARAGDADAAAVALEYRDAQGLFQFANGLGHRGLADVEQAGGLDHALLARNLEEGLQMTEADTVVDHAISITLELRKCHEI
jgi:hypothetical protein